jgi:ATP-dependent DNA ligase
MCWTGKTWCCRRAACRTDGLKAWQDVLERGYEGLVAKDPASPYVGGRTLSWLKVKQPHYREGERGWRSRT